MKSILITGCSSGIGLYVAQYLHRNGYQVIASARKEHDVAHLKSLGLTAIQLDLTCSDSIRIAYEQTIAYTHGQLYALFNNGGYGQPGAVEDLTREIVRAQFETNLFGWLELTNYFLPIMRKQGYGRIIQNSSMLGMVALRFRGAYVASKFALEGISDTLRLELKDTGIHVILIEPGPILSKFRENSLDVFKQTINIDSSPFKSHYQATLHRLAKQGAAVPFTLGPHAVLKKVMHALESKHPRPHYYVTFPSYLYATLKRFLPTRVLDQILLITSKLEASKN